MERWNSSIFLVLQLTQGQDTVAETLASQRSGLLKWSDRSSVPTECFKKQNSVFFFFNISSVILLGLTFLGSCGIGWFALCNHGDYPH